MLETWLTSTLDLQVPILGAPMGGRAGSELVIAVSRAGGLGMLGAARYTTPEWIAEQGNVIRESGAKFGVGLQTWSLDDDRMVAATVEAAPALVSLSFGDPAPFVGSFHAAGIPVLAQVNTLDDLRTAEAAGVDVVAAQGTEAGGHTGRVATLPLLQEILDATQLPVLAAGGIATGRGLAAVLAAGAQGALVGTALLASPETVGPAYARERVVAATATDTVYTDVFDKARDQPWPPRWFGRAIANEFTARFHGADADNATLAAAYDADNGDIGVVYAGEAAGLVRAQRPAGEIVRAIAAEAEALLSRFR